MDDIPEVNAFEPRQYQDQLLDIVLKQNTIVYLPTGAGKTFIAVMAIRHMAKDVQESLSKGGKRTIFLTNTVVLAQQQYKLLKNATNLKTAVHCGNFNVLNWTRSKWYSEFENNQLIVATCQIMLDVVRHGFISVTNFNLIIFDECHHAKNDHPMHQLMAQFQYQKESDLPRVIGLTGVLIPSSKKNTILGDLETLEKTFRAKIATAANAQEFSNALAHSTRPLELLVTYRLTTNNLPICTKIELLVRKCMKVILNWELGAAPAMSTKKLGGERQKGPIRTLYNLFNDFIYQMFDLGTFGSYIAILQALIELEARKKTSETIIYRNLIRVCISYCEHINHLLTEYLYNATIENTQKEHEFILKNSTIKVYSFLMNVQQMASKRNRTEIKGIIFVERRNTAKNLCHILKRYVTSAEIPIVPEYMVGKQDSTNLDIECILEKKWNRNTIEKFQCNECNLIVSSSVLEEGINVQSCNFVYSYDPIQTFRSYIQMKGRARMPNSLYVILTSSIEKPQTLEKLAMYKEMDKVLKSYLIDKTIDRNIPMKKKIDNENFIKPFITSKGAQLDSKSAISLLNRYCNSLPNDIFTCAKVNWEKIYQNLEEKNVIVKLTLPLQSTIKNDVFSDIMKNVKWAKRSAAFKACKMLYENGELTDDLLPIDCRKCLDMVNDKYFEHWGKYLHESALLAGTKKNRRNYEQIYPTEYYSATPNTGNNCYLYIIRLEPSYERNEGNWHFEELLLTDNHFGILTTKVLPRLARMPLFFNQGKVTGFIDPNPKVIELTEKNDLVYLRNFHVMVFRDILKIWKKFFAYNFANQDNSYYIVPTILNGKEIDWDLVKCFQNLPEISRPTMQQRSVVKFYPEDYINRVVTTSYTTDPDLRYIIKNVRQDLTPFSRFPTNTFPNFASYFTENYNVSITQKDQFLLEAVPIRNTLNRLHIGVDMDELKKKSDKGLDTMILIPELCHNFKFPGDMWLKATFIPSILHRMRYLLIAEKLRVDINKFLNLNLKDYIPEELIYDISKTLKKSRPSGETKFACNWEEHGEPFDFERNIDSVPTTEVDYYQNVVTIDPNFTVNLKDISVSSLTDNLPVIRNVLTAEKANIHILDINKVVKSAEQWEFLSSITATSSNDVFDMGRFEVFGDSFLKFGISLFLLHEHPQWNEGNLTEVKEKFVSNQNLFYASVEKNFPGLLKVIAFKPKEYWQPPLLSVPQNAFELMMKANIGPNVLLKLSLGEDEIRSGKCTNETLTQFAHWFSLQDNDSESPMQAFVDTKTISDKTCAGSMKAILGVCAKNYGIHNTFSCLNYLGILPEIKDLSNLLYINLGSPRLKKTTRDSDIDGFLNNYIDLENNLGYTFKDRAYLLQALTHPSFVKNRLTGCYQQLKFLGNAILNFLISCYIFERCEKLDPGVLTELYSALLDNVTLACLSVRYKFHLHMLSQNALLSQSITKFAEFEKTQNYIVTDQVRILVSEFDSNSERMADYVQVPKALADIFEALVGAIFMDSKNSLHTTWNTIYQLMSKEINEFSKNVPIKTVRRLYEYDGANPHFEKPIVCDDVVMVNCRFTCKDKIHVASGFSSKNEFAKISAAKLALQVLEESN